ncbi:alpha/beta-hydrolase [Piromyces finnis]|uniref:acylaminoacyl-peptidase n=1 Tax=Piromyces finnis TaxID=1754191 RepID=A0A1Y1UHJ6_9FUNG|nr:alpha/beta-hydrolase [Piromyces finnis]|eukprot:ORX36555.1 alpha/beta-hydrolase [Piromyces finnis]
MNENIIAYIAEERKPYEETKSYKTYTYNEDWGEKNDKKLKPQIVVLNLITKDVTIIHTESSAGHVSITTDNKLVFAQFPDKIKYGMIYCTNRYSTVWQCNMNGNNMECIINQQTSYKNHPLITSNHAPVENVRSLRYDPEGNALYFLSNPVTFFPHGSCSRLFKYNLNTKTLTLIIDYVNEISEKYGDALSLNFPGIFSHQLPHQCCQHFIIEGLKKESIIFLTITWGTRQTIIAVKESTGTLMDLTVDKIKGNWNIVYISSNYILANVKSPSQPSCLMLGKITINGRINVQWTPISTSDYGEENNIILNNICSISKTLKNPTTGGEFDIIVDLIHPLLLIFSPLLTGLVSFGYTITLINYTGSLGYGQKKVLELVGKIGELDISDCYTAAEAVKKMTLDTVTIDTEKVFYNGGSHGGFIGAHMISKYPSINFKKYYLKKRCCLRNPVINCGGMLLTSDIPEWSPLELGINWDMNQPPIISGELYQKAFDCSPIKNVDHVVTPLLLLLGEMDRRVPRQDSFIYARLLKSKNKDVEVVLFPETGHALDSIEAEKYSFEAIVNKFSKYL